MSIAKVCTNYATKPLVTKSVIGARFQDSSPPHFFTCVGSKAVATAASDALSSEY